MDITIPEIFSVLCQVSCNVFKGKTLVDVREFYQAGGEMKPSRLDSSEDISTRIFST